MYYHVIGNFTTNLAECWMGIRAKFDGGKQYNRSQRGAWEGRCTGAGLRHNLGPEWGAVVWKQVTGNDPNPVLKDSTAKRSRQVATDRNRKAREDVKRKRKEVRYGKSNDNTVKARRDYARHDGGLDVRDVPQDVPATFLEDMMVDYYRAHVSVSVEKSLEIEGATKSQAAADDLASNRWKAERRKRVTGSKCGQIAKRRSTTKVANLVKSLLYTTFRGNTATQWGVDQEPDTELAYLQYKRLISPNITVVKSGFVIHPYHHWLGASPDGLVNDPTSTDPHGIVEYKNLYSVRNISLEEAATTKKTDFCLAEKKGLLHLKRTHSYFYQIQATMYCTGRRWCDFVVRTIVSLHVERVSFDEDFWKSSMLPLRKFYFTAILPELAVPRLHNGGIREPSEWLDMESLNQKTEQF